MTTTAFVNYYEILSLAETASADQIKAAIKSQRRIWIKRQASADPGRRTEAESRVRYLDEAENLLLAANQRQVYDRRLNEQRASGAPIETPTESGADWLDRARSYLDVGNAGAAHRAAREATNQRGADHAAWYVRAHSSFLLGQVADAEFEFAEAIRIAPEEPDYHHDLGEVYSAQEKWPNALREFETALRLAPGNPVSRTGVAQVLLATDQNSRALEIMEAVVRENPGSEYFKYYLAAALESTALGSLSLLRDDTIIPTSLAQVEHLERNASRIESLRLADPEATQAVNELRRMASAAREQMWVHSSQWQVYGITLGILLCGFCAFMGSGDGSGIALSLFVFGPLTAGVIWLYMTRHRKARYLHAAQQLGAQIVRRGI